MSPTGWRGPRPNGWRPLVPKSTFSTVDTASPSAPTARPKVPRRRSPSTSSRVSSRSTSGSSCTRACRSACAPSTPS
ncbi:hypothetical protein [Reyranella sp.]|uniref:hypothetical protein n=1 Tax=Reyranella sp. TaxID=1929291 RepID=UPI003443AB74